MGSETAISEQFSYDEIGNFFKHGLKVLVLVTYQELYNDAFYFKYQPKERTDRYRRLVEVSVRWLFEASILEKM